MDNAETYYITEQHFKVFKNLEIWKLLKDPVPWQIFCYATIILLWLLNWDFFFLSQNLEHSYLYLSNKIYVSQMYSCSCQVLLVPPWFSTFYVSHQWMKIQTALDASFNKPCTHLHPMPFVPIKLMKTFFSLLSLPPEEARPATLPFPSYRTIKKLQTLLYVEVV